MKFPIKDVTTKDDSLNEPRLAKELDETATIYTKRSRPTARSKQCTKEDLTYCLCQFGHESIKAPCFLANECKNNMLAAVMMHA